MCKSIHECTQCDKVISNCVHFVLTIIFLAGSRIHQPSKPTSILKTAAGSATLQSFHFSPASLLWLHHSWCTWILCKLSRLNKLLTLLRSQSEWNLILIPVTLYFVFPPHCLECLHFNEWGNVVPHTNLRLLLCWGCWPCFLSAWIWEPGRGFSVRCATLSLFNCLEMQFNRGKKCN